MRTLRRVGWIAAEVLCLGGIVVIAVAALGPRADDTVDTGEITYTLTWSTEGVEASSDGSITIVTDLGYEVTVTDGTLAAYSATVVACEDGDDSRADDDSGDGVVAALGGLVGTPDAVASHGETFDEQVEGPVVETLGSPDTTVLGTTTVGSDPYCEAHVAFARASTVGADEDELAAFTTLELEGTVVAPDGTVTPLSVATSLPWAASDELLDPSGEGLELRGADVTVEVRRDLSRLFDGVDFTELEDDDLERALLRSIAGATSFVVTDPPADSAS